MAISVSICLHLATCVAGFTIPIEDSSVQRIGPVLIDMPCFDDSSCIIALQLILDGMRTATGEDKIIAAHNDNITNSSNIHRIREIAASLCEVKIKLDLAKLQLNDTAAALSNSGVDSFPQSGNISKELVPLAEQLVVIATDNR